MILSFFHNIMSLTTCRRRYYSSPSLVLDWFNALRQIGAVTGVEGGLHQRPNRGESFAAENGMGLKCFMIYCKYTWIYIYIYTWIYIYIYIHMNICIYIYMYIYIYIYIYTYIYIYYVHMWVLYLVSWYVVYTYVFSPQGFEILYRNT